MHVMLKPSEKFPELFENITILSENNPKHLENCPIGFGFYKARHDGQEKFSLAVKCPDVLPFEPNADSLSSEVSDCIEEVHSVTSEPRYALREDDINQAVVTVRKHTLKSRARSVCPCECIVSIYSPASHSGREEMYSLYTSIWFSRECSDVSYLKRQISQAIPILKNILSLAAA